jgi:hypothetical protein
MKSKEYSPIFAKPGIPIEAPKKKEVPEVVYPNPAPIKEPVKVPFEPVPAGLRIIR